MTFYKCTNNRFKIPKSVKNSVDRMSVRMKISVVGDGMLADGTLYHRQLSVVEFQPNNGIVKEISVDEITIKGLSGYTNSYIRDTRSR